jgi:hypothetical protein
MEYYEGHILKIRTFLGDQYSTRDASYLCVSNGATRNFSNVQNRQLYL